MASPLKNHILKHLFKFTKNVSSDAFQLNAFKGSFEVSNIELNETLLMDLLQFPGCLSLTKAHCNNASIKIQWTKLKTVPIHIMLDKVVIELETCQNFNSNLPMENKINLNDETDNYRYIQSFINQILDGITISINTAVIHFSSSILKASFELTGITIQSPKSCSKAVASLSKRPRLDLELGQELPCKHIEWQTLDLVAKSKVNSPLGQVPLRLTGNQAIKRPMVLSK